MREPNGGEMMKKMFLVPLMAWPDRRRWRHVDSRSTACSYSKLGDTIAWIQQNINASAKWSSHGLATPIDTLRNCLRELLLWPGCSLPSTLIAHKQSTNTFAESGDTSYNINLSASTANSIQAVPFDLVTRATGFTPIVPAEGDTMTSPYPSSWEIEGLMQPMMTRGQPFFQDSPMLRVIRFCSATRVSRNGLPRRSITRSISAAASRPQRAFSSCVARIPRNRTHAQGTPKAMPCA